MPPMYEFQASVRVSPYFWRKQRAGVNEQVDMLAQSHRNFEAADQSLHYRIKDDYTMPKPPSSSRSCTRKPSSHGGTWRWNHRCPAPRRARWTSSP